MPNSYQNWSKEKQELSSAMSKDISILQTGAIELLAQLIATPSFSTDEDQTAGIIKKFFAGRNVAVEQQLNNIWVKNKYYDAGKPTILLNSHHDTVKPNK